MKLFFHRIRHWGLQLLRRCVQLAVVALLVGLAYLSVYAHCRATRAIEDEETLAGTRGKVLAAIHQRVDAMEDPQQFLDDNKGTVWSMRIAGVDLADPLAAAEPTAASRSIHRPLFAAILIPVLATLVLGKVFCSWICPANLLFEITGKLRGLLRFAELPPAEVRFSRRNKYVLLVIGLAMAAITAAPMFALIYPPAIVSRLLHAWVFGTAMTGMLILLGSIVAVDVLISPRWWCRTMCPGGALYGLLGWPRLLRVKLNAERCTMCRECEPACQPGLDPVRQSYGIECDNCGECVRVCPERALRFTVGLPAVRKKSEATPESKAGTKAATVVALMTLVLLMPSTAHGHHILGLPHYSYKENYPQVPVLEYPATTGPYDVLFQCYPGKPVPGEAANLVFDIRNSATGQRYQQPIGVRVLQTSTFGANREILPATQIQSFDVLYKASATFPDDGEYVVELSMDVEGQPEVIGFLMVAGDPSATTSIVVAVVGGLALFLIVVRAIKKKRDRRKEQSANPQRFEPRCVPS